MESRTKISLIAITLLAALAVPVRAAAQQYTVTDLGTLGGTFSQGFGISNRGWVDGLSSLPGDATTHAFLWQGNIMTDVGMPGLNSLAAFPFNERGEVALITEILAPDPLGEDFCSFGTHLECPPFLWQSGVLTRLPTLGGNNGHANQVNNEGVVAGVVESTTNDSTCQDCVEGVICPFQVLQTKPVLWKVNHIQELPTYQDDPDGNALVINDNGQVAGTSGQCIASNKEALHAVIWQNGTVTDLGNLGGDFNNHPQYINNEGQVVGFSNLPGNATFHAFLWQKGLMTDLGTLPGDFLSFGQSINDTGEVGGSSCDKDGNCRAFRWQGGEIIDLNTLVPGGSPLLLLDAFDINSRGEIVGDAFDTTTGEVHAYLATPVNGSEITVAGGNSERPKVILPENVRSALRQRLGSHYHIPSLAAPKD